MIRLLAGRYRGALRKMRDLVDAAKYFAAETGFRACERAILTHGGMGYSKEFHVERYLREIMIPRITPISQELILSHIAERILGMPKSY